MNIYDSMIIYINNKKYLLRNRDKGDYRSALPHRTALSSVYIFPFIVKPHAGQRRPAV